MNEISVIFFLTTVVSSFLIISCSSGSKQKTTPAQLIENKEYSSPIPNAALIKNVDIHILESFPVQASVAIEGHLPNTCSTIDDVTIDRIDQTFTIQIPLLQQKQSSCVQKTQVINHVIPLDIVGLKAGIYTVKVNDIEKTFELVIDNII